MNRRSFIIIVGGFLAPYNLLAQPKKSESLINVDFADSIHEVTESLIKLCKGIKSIFDDSLNHIKYYDLVQLSKKLEDIEFNKASRILDEYLTKPNPHSSDWEKAVNEVEKTLSIIDTAFDYINLLDYLPNAVRIATDSVFVELRKLLNSRKGTLNTVKDLSSLSIKEHRKEINDLNIEYKVLINKIDSIRKRLNEYIKNKK